MGVLYLTFFPVAWPQEALRHSLAGEQAAAARARALENQDYNLKIGNARFLANTSLSTEYNDNVRYRDTLKQSDVILRPQVNSSLYWPITARNVLTFSLGLGYNKYVRHSEYDYMLITPGSQLSFDLFVKDFVFTFYDRFAYTQDPGENASLSGVARYGGIDNSAGLNAIWDLNQAVLAAGYAHNIFIPDQTAFEYLDRSSELFLTRLSFLPNQTVAFGPEGTASLTSYDQSFLHDALSYSGGAFAEVKVSPHLRFGVHGGYVAYNFDDGGITVAAENPSTYYFNANISHTISQFIQHSLSGGRDLRLGTYSDFEEQYFARYNITWTIKQNLGLGTSLFYENGSYPPLALLVGSSTPVFIGGEDYDRVGATVTLNYRFMEKLTSTLSYRILLKDSDVNSRDYTQNSINLGLTYRF